jgi:hypothetical protein
VLEAGIHQINPLLSESELERLAQPDGPDSGR